MTDSRKIAIYLRLSIEDDALDGKASTEQRESNSISNQRKMLLDYIRNDAELMQNFVMTVFPVRIWTDRGCWRC